MVTVDHVVAGLEVFISGSGPAAGDGAAMGSAATQYLPLAQHGQLEGWKHDSGVDALGEDSRADRPGHPLDDRHVQAVLPQDVRHPVGGRGAVHGQDHIRTGEP